MEVSEKQSLLSAAPQLSKARSLAVKSTPVAATSTAPAVTWQDYVHVLLMESGNVARAAIHGTKDGQLLGCTEDLCLSPEQVANLVRGFEDCTHLRTEGLQVGSETFTLTRVTDHRIMVGRDACTGGGCVIYRCDSCLIAAVYEDGNHPGGCYTLVTRLGDFLVERGY